MDSDLVKNLLTTPKQEKYKILNDFNEKFEGSISYEISKENFKELWNEVVGLLMDDACRKAHADSLTALKILSRKKAYLNENVTEHIVNRVLYVGDLKAESGSDKKSGSNIDFDVVRAAQKCLSNMIFNSEQIQKWCCSNSFIPGLFNRLKKFKNAVIPTDVIWFDLRLIFLLSGKCANVRNHIRIEHHGSDVLADILVTIVTKSQSESNTSKAAKADNVISGEMSGICIESLKTLYNLLYSMDHKNLSKHDESFFLRLINILRNLMLSSVVTVKEADELHSNVVNQLLLMPTPYYNALIPVVSSKDSQAAQYNGKNMEVIVKILNFLQYRLCNTEKCNTDGLSPVMSLLIEMCMHNRIIRKYIRICILPPLKDVSKRPEEGDEIRNKLCGLMTSPVPQLKQASADLIFILCKESVDRLVKYTGYGNAAGLLASRGLMLGGKGNSSNYSSDSEQSDTEEYEKVKNQINPVTGRLEPPHASPFEGMSEEQKEYETMKLVNALDKLNRQNIIQPCVIDEDGRPRPVSHVSDLRNDSKPDKS